MYQLLLMICQSIVVFVGYVCLCHYAPSLGCDIGNSIILIQLVAGSIIVMHIKSNTFFSLPLQMYGHMRSTHNVSQGVVMASFAGSFPYLWFLRLFTWQLWHFLTCDWTVFLRPYQYTIHRETKSFLETCVPGMLKVVVIPSYCTLL